MDGRSRRPSFFFQKNKSVRAILPAEKKGLAREKIGSIV
jgi:hypothetical protein